MAGILNNKQRIFDTVLTTEGRRQISEGSFRIAFASLADAATFYEADAVSGSTDASTRIFFEAPTSKRDQITFETRDNGVLVPFLGAGQALRVIGNKIVSGSSPLSNGRRFATAAEEILSASLDNYKNLYSLGSEDIFLETGRFELSRNEATFIITDKTPLSMDKDVTQTSIENVESFYQDKRLSHIPNFKYLPPVNKGTSDAIGEFPCRGQTEILTYDQLLTDLEGKEKVEVTFPSTSRENNLVSQMFELANGNFQKLDVIDFGEFIVPEDENPVKQVYFVGKIFKDRFGNGTFVNLFVLVYE